MLELQILELIFLFPMMFHVSKITKQNVNSSKDSGDGIMYSQKINIVYSLIFTISYLTMDGLFQCKIYAEQNKYFSLKNSHWLTSKPFL